MRFVPLYGKGDDKERGLCEEVGVAEAELTVDDDPALRELVANLSPLEGLQFGVACVHEILQVAQETIRAEIAPEQRTRLHRIFGEVQRAVGEQAPLPSFRVVELREELTLCAADGTGWSAALDCLLRYCERPSVSLLMAISRELMSTLKSLRVPEGGERAPEPQHESPSPVSLAQDLPQNWPRVPRRRVSAR